MFTQLAPLAAKATLLIIVAPASNGRLRLTINPKGDDEKKSALASFVAEGTAEELDAGLADALNGYTEKNLGLAAAQVSADAEIATLTAEKGAQVAAARKPASKPEPKKTSGPAAEAPAHGTETLPLGLESEPTTPPATAAE